MQLLPGLYQISGSLSGLSGSQVEKPFSVCNSYALKVGSDIILVDCGTDASWPETERIMQMWGLDSSKICALLLTHAHYDHAQASHLLKEKGVPIYAHQQTALAIASGDHRCCGYLYHAEFSPVTADVILQDQQSITISGLSIQALHLPGHTLGCTSYLVDWEGKKILFTGDVIGTLGYGHFGWDGSIDFDKKLYLKSLLRLVDIPFDVMLPGHGLCSFHNPKQRVEVSLNEALMQWR